MANVSVQIGATRDMAVKALDAAGNDISSLCQFTFNSSDPATVSVANYPLLGGSNVWRIKGLKMGSATITVTATDAAGAASNTDTVTVTEQPPATVQVSYS